jgi:serine/threonine protein kinase
MISVSAMASPPATPPSELPSGSQSWRFIQTGASCEWAEEYRPGGLHPVNLGDTFHDGKYKVIRKLGDGSYSTVWLAVASWYSYL